MLISFDSMDFFRVGFQQIKGRLTRSQIQKTKSDSRQFLKKTDRSKKIQYFLSLESIYAFKKKKNSRCIIGLSLQKEKKEKRVKVVIRISCSNGTSHFRFRLWERCDGLHVESMCLHWHKASMRATLYR